MNKILAVFAIVLSLLGCSSKPEPEVLLRSSQLVNPDHSWYKAFEYLSEELERRSNGRMVLEVYHSEQLAKESEAIRLIQAGVIDMTNTGSILSNWSEIISFCEMPFLLRDSTDMKTLIEGPVGQQIEAEMVNMGLKPLGYFARGPRHLTSNRPIRHPDDLRGLILRVPNVPSFVNAWNALGAKPTPMAFSEVFTSLQQGTVEGQENPFAMIKSAGFAEVQQYVNLTSHVVSWTYPVIGVKQFEALPPDLQRIFLEAAADMQRHEHEIFLKAEAQVQAQLQEAGMEFVEVDRDAFSEKCRDGLIQSLSPAMQEVYQQIWEQTRSSD
ncbi:MAG: TRAP transporter substrate-binding protein [Bacteroidota bacterium]